MNKWLKPSRPEGDPIRCDALNCAHGMGQAGAGRCPGDWTKPGRECPEFVTDEDMENIAQNKANDEAGEP